jgi:hypothetical protein
MIGAPIETAHNFAQHIPSPGDVISAIAAGYSSGFQWRGADLSDDLVPGIIAPEADRSGNPPVWVRTRRRVIGSRPLIANSGMYFATRS